MWVLLLLSACTNITDEGVDAIADKCRKVQVLNLL